MEFVDLEKATPEQRFILMLVERVERLEQEIDRHDKTLYPYHFPEESDSLFLMLKNYNENIDKEEFEKEDKGNILKLIPVGFHNLLSDWEIKNLKSTLECLQVPATTDKDIQKVLKEAYLALIWLRGIKSAEVVKWLTRELENYTGMKLC